MIVELQTDSQHWPKKTGICCWIDHLTPPNPSPKQIKQVEATAPEVQKNYETYYKPQNTEPSCFWMTSLRQVERCFANSVNTLSAGNVSVCALAVYTHKWSLPKRSKTGISVNLKKIINLENNKTELVKKKKGRGLNLAWNLLWNKKKKWFKKSAMFMIASLHGKRCPDMFKPVMFCRRSLRGLCLCLRNGWRREWQSRARFKRCSIPPVNACWQD